MYDIIVVGGGHNGLTCAAYLARAGHQVLVLEANPKVGGFCMTDEMPGAPGFRMNTYVIDMLFTSASPSVADELDLSRHGLQWISPDPHNTYLGPDGTTFALWRDLGRTCESIARISRRDADYYESFMKPIMDLTHALVPYLQDHPTRPSPRTLASMVKRVVKSRRNLLPGARLLMSTPMQIIEGFEREELRAFFAMNCLTGSFRPLDEPANTTLFLYFAGAHLFPIQRPAGGAGAFAEALANYIRAHGGEVRTDVPVHRILTEGGRATGVVLHSGEKIDARQVVAATDPTSLYTKLLDSSVVPSKVQTEVSRFQVLANNISHFKGDIALARRPRFPRHPLPENEFAGFTIAPDLKTIEEMQAASFRGQLPDRVGGAYAAIPSIADRSLVPDGSEGEVVYIFMGTVPYALSDGTDWADAKKDYLDKIVVLLDEYAPGLADDVLASHAGSPRDFNQPWVHKGSSRGVDVVGSQIGPWRPSPLLSGYRTPIGGLWQTGHGTHPISGVSGWSGRTAARSLLKASGGKRRSV